LKISESYSDSTCCHIMTDMMRDVQCSTRLLFIPYTSMKSKEN